MIHCHYGVTLTWRGMQMASRLSSLPLDSFRLQPLRCSNRMSDGEYELSSDRASQKITLYGSKLTSHVHF